MTENSPPPALLPTLLPYLRHWRRLQLLVFLACVGMIGYALYEQLAHWLMPCLMCVYQRMAVIGVGLAALLGLLRPPATRWEVYGLSGLQTVAALGGVVAAGRHAFLQYVPHETTVACASSLPFPVNFDHPDMPAWLATLLRPVGDCSQIDFSLLGLSMPVWVLLACAGLAVLALLLGWARLRVLAEAHA